MSIPLTHIEEKISLAYVLAVSAKASTNCEYSRSDYGIDGTFQRITKHADGGRTSDGFLVPFQIKSSINCEEKGENIAYDMDATHYNHFVLSNDPSKLLILLKLPKSDFDWVSVNETNLICKHCCYYVFLSGNVRTNKGKVRIKIPRKNLLTPEAIIGIVKDYNTKRGSMT